MAVRSPRAGRQRPRPGFVDLLEEFVDALEGRHKVEWVDRRIAAIAASYPVERREAGDVMDPAHQARLVADFPWPMPSARAVGRPAIEGYAHEGDVDLVRLGDRQAHEGRKAGKSRHQA